MGDQAQAFLRRVSGLLATKWHQPYCTTMQWMRARITCALSRASSHCIRGTRYREPTHVATYYPGALGAGAGDDLLHILQRDTITELWATNSTHSNQYLLAFNKCLIL
jgi:hypothetical protein